MGLPAMIRSASRRGITPTKKDRPFIQMTGSASAELATTVHRRFVSAPQTTSATQIGARTRSGTVIAKVVLVSWTFALPATLSTHSGHREGARANETAAIARGAPAAIARGRHSRRARKHGRPTPGV